MAGVEDVDTILLHLRACQYVAASGFVILLYDHLLTFSDEVRLIWQAKCTVAKLLFLYNRYVVPISMLIQTVSYSGVGGVVLSDQFCKQWGATAFTFGVVSIATSDFMVLLRLWVIWDRRIKLVVWTMFLFILSVIATGILLGFLISHIITTIAFDPSMHICKVSSELHMGRVWAPGVASQIVVFVTALWNAYDKPRTQHMQMTRILYRDGTMYFAALVALRAANLVLAAVMPVSLQFLGTFFVWCTTTLTVSRLVLDLRAISECAEGDEDDSAEELKSLPMLHLHDSHSTTAVTHDFNPHKCLPTPRGTLKGYSSLSYDVKSPQRV